MRRLVDELAQARRAKGSDRKIASLGETEVDPAAWAGASGCGARRTVARDDPESELTAKRGRQRLEALVGTAGVVSWPEAAEEDEDDRAIHTTTRNPPAIASEARLSNGRRGTRLGCFVAKAPRNDG